MRSVIPKLEKGVFNPEATASMAAALEDVCRALKVNVNRREREILASRIVDLAHDGEHDRDRLRERIIWEAARATDALQPF